MTISPRKVHPARDPASWDLSGPGEAPSGPPPPRRGALQPQDTQRSSPRGQGPRIAKTNTLEFWTPRGVQVFFSAPYETEGFSLGAPAPSHNQPKCPKPPKNPKCQASRNRTRPRSSLFGGSGATTRRRRDPTCLATLNSATKSCLHENLGPRNAFSLFSGPFDLRARRLRVV